MSWYRSTHLSPIDFKVSLNFNRNDFDLIGLRVSSQQHLDPDQNNVVSFYLFSHYTYPLTFWISKFQEFNSSPILYLSLAKVYVYVCDAPPYTGE